MTKNPVTISPDETITICARKMLSKNIGGIIIKDNNGKLEGIVTEKDIVEQAVGKELNIKKTKVKDIMTTGMITISPDADLMDAINLMKREDVRRVPVIKNNKVVGLLTQKDILKIEPELFKEILTMLLKK